MNPASRESPLARKARYDWSLKVGGTLISALISDLFKLILI